MGGLGKTISVYNSRNQHHGWRGVTFKAQETTEVDPLLFKQFLLENQQYGTNGLEYDADELTRMLLEIKQTYFAGFEAMGVASVAASVKGEALSKGDKHSLALEWLETKKERRERWKMFWAAISAISATGIVGYLIKRFWGDEF